ncbi:23S rRNA pseudouridine(2605) synthase RluB [soil metagenome]
MTEKIQKVLANAGLGSRREIETWIAAGRVKVDDVVAKLGDRIGPKARVQVDGRRVHYSAAKAPTPRVLLYHKPVGEMCTRSDPEGRPTVFERLPFLKEQRWIMVGRLDLNTAGLLLFTTDGELANKLMHPSYGLQRTYAVRTFGEVDKQMISRLKGGVQLEDGLARFDSVSDAGGEGSNHWYHVSLHEGRQRIVRRLWESQGIVVSRLIRIRFGAIELPRSLRPSHFLELPETDIKTLQRQVKR